MRAAVVGTLFTTLIAAGAAEAQVMAGGEFRVNADTTAYLSLPAIAADPTGAFVVTWVERADVDARPRAVLMQRFDAAGARRGPQLAANEGTLGIFQRPDVAVDATGRALIVWANGGDTATGVTPGVFGRFVDPEGALVGSEFTISTTPAFEPSAVATPSGFVVVWSADDGGAGGGGNNTAGLAGRRVDVAGNPLGPEFEVHTSATGFQYVPRVAAADSGDFVVVWSSLNEDQQVMARHFDAAGAPAAGELLVGTYASYFLEASVAADKDGRFVVAWSGYGGVRARRFGSDGTPEGGDFAVNSAPASSFYSATVASDKSGNFTIVWEAGPIDNTEVFARRFTDQGVPRGAQFPVTAGRAGIQPNPASVSDAAGNVFAAWVSTHLSSNRQVFGQRLGGLLAAGMQVIDGANSIIEVGDNFMILPAWRNHQGTSQSFQGRLTAMDVPEGLVLDVSSDINAYGTVGDGDMGGCVGPCFTGSLTGTRPPRHVDVQLVETIVPDAQGQAKQWRVHVGDTFTDVPRSSANYRSVETLVHHNITGGCTASLFCPANPTTREQMAVFVLLAKEGAGYLPPACEKPMFGDVPASSSFCPWVEELVRREAASGCGSGSFCANAPVPRDQMAVMVLRVLDPTFEPPACTTPMFEDVPAESPYCPWIEELVRRGVVTPCAPNRYCPADPVTRETMAQFIAGTFTLELYGPLVGHVPWRPGDPRERPADRAGDR